MEIKEFIKGIWSGVTFTFTLSMVVMIAHLLLFGDGYAFARDIIAVFIMSVLIYFAGIVLCSNRGLKRGELLVRHILRLILVIGIITVVAVFMGWLLWSEPATIALFIIAIAVIYSIAIASEFYESKKLISNMNQKLKERNKV